ALALYTITDYHRFLKDFVVLLKSDVEVSLVSNRKGYCCITDAGNTESCSCWNRKGEVTVNVCNRSNCGALCNYGSTDNGETITKESL
ncbi:MAG: hypothetical protein SPL03_05290, partial [Succinivibrio dextrinosolvens]|nr:hypothetical protein [Succinivibrio dextrinosolvens]